MLYRPGQNTSRGLGIGGGAAQTDAQPYTDQTFGTPAALPYPLEARLKQTGEAVTLLQTCDWKGNSPAGIGVDQRGELFLGTFDEMTVTDARVVPNPAVDQIRGYSIRQTSAAGLTPRPFGG